MDLSQNHQELEDNGYTIVKNLIDPKLIEELLEAVEKLEFQLQRSPDNNRFEGNRTTRTYNLLAHLYT